MTITKHLLVSDMYTFSNSLFIEEEEEEEGGRWQCLGIGVFFRYFNQNVNMSNNAVANTNANGTTDFQFLFIEFKRTAE